MTGGGSTGCGRPLPRLWQAAVLALLAYCLGYGLGVYTSLRYMVIGAEASSASAPSPSQISSLLAGSACLVLLALSSAAVAVSRLRTLGVTWRDWFGLQAQDGGGAEGTLAAFVAVFSASLLGWFAVSVLGRTGGGLPNGLEGGTWRQVAVASVLAGVGEELVVLALPCLILRCAAPYLGRGWVVGALFALVAMRMAYHLYQGPSALAHVPWAVATIWAFYRYGRVWALILAHVLFDGLVMSTDGLPLAAWVLFAVLPLVGWSLARYLRTRSPRTVTRMRGWAGVRSPE